MRFRFLRTIPATIATSRSAGGRRGVGASRAGSANPSAARRCTAHQAVVRPASSGQGSVYCPHHVVPGPLRPEPRIAVLAGQWGEDSSGAWPASPRPRSAMGALSRLAGRCATGTGDRAPAAGGQPHHVRAPLVTGNLLSARSTSHRAPGSTSPSQLVRASVLREMPDGRLGMRSPSPERQAQDRHVGKRDRSQRRSLLLGREDPFTNAMKPVRHAVAAPRRPWSELGRSIKPSSYATSGWERNYDDHLVR